MKDPPTLPTQPLSPSQQSFFSSAICVLFITYLHPHDTPVNSLGGMLVNSFDKLKSPSSSEETIAVNQGEEEEEGARFVSQ